jgi:hypothetical protein
MKSNPPAEDAGGRGEGPLSRLFGVLWKSLPEGREEPVRFRFEPGPGTLTLDPPMDGLPRESPELPSKQVEFLESRVRAAAPFPVARVSLFFFHCRQCGDVVPADTGHWSVGLCVSCSMDNASDMAEREG